MVWQDSFYITNKTLKMKWNKVIKCISSQRWYFHFKMTLLRIAIQSAVIYQLWWAMSVRIISWHRQLRPHYWWQISKSAWSLDGKIMTKRKPKCSEENLSLCLINHKSHINQHGIKPGPLWWEASNWPPDPQHSPKTHRRACTHVLTF